jgi:hypothetical protein
MPFTRIYIVIVDALLVEHCAQLLLVNVISVTVWTYHDKNAVALRQQLHSIRIKAISVAKFPHQFGKYFRVFVESCG